MISALRVAVVGAGAFGRNHLRVLHDLTAASAAPNTAPDTPDPRPPRIQLAAVVEPNPHARQEAATRYGIPGFATVEDLLDVRLGLHAATVCVPTRAHAQVAGRLLTAGLDVLVEKPLAASLAEADTLIRQATASGRILAAGHLERFNPAVTAALPRLTRPMFFEAHRLSVFTPRSLDVDVVLDLMIHDLDILLTMAHSPVREVRAVGLPVLTPNVDIANVRLEFASGAVANLTASRVSTEQVRKLRLFQPAQYLSLDYARQELLTINVDARSAPPGAPTALNPGSAPAPASASNLEDTVGNSATGNPAAGNPAAGNLANGNPATGNLANGNPATGSLVDGNPAQPHPSSGLTFHKLNLPRAEPLRLELEDFLAAVQTRTLPRVTAQAAREALALALEINTAIATHTRQTGLL